MAVRDEEINRDLYSPTRFRIVGLLRRYQQMDFKTIQQELDLSSSDLSKSLKLLEDGGYVMVAKGRRGRYGTTMASLSDHGRAELERLLAVIQRIAGP